MVCWQKHVHLDSLYIIPSTYSNVKFRPVHLGCPQFCWREFANTERIIEMTSHHKRGAIQNIKVQHRITQGFIN
jgi:hypothetical protein